MRSILSYFASFSTAAVVWLILSVVTALYPFMSWEYPVLALVLGWSFPGGAPAELHFVSHALQMWLPFLMASFIARRLTFGQFRLFDGIKMYLGYLAFAACLVFAVSQGLPLGLAMKIGMAGSFLGGLLFYAHCLRQRIAA